nr:reverse transcriptase domain-containing protein [Tanacetum cinerariifolium]
MRTRNSYFSNNLSVTIPRRRNKRRTPNIVEPELRTIVEVGTMEDNYTMEELIQAPTEGYGEAIAILEINADHFEIKTNLLQLVQANSDVSNDVIKLMMFSYSLEGSARIWYDKEPPNSILTWEDIVNKFVNQFFPPSKNTHLKNEGSRFTQRLEETFGEAWERFKEMLRAALTMDLRTVEESCITCGGPHAYYNCPNTDSNQSSVCAATGTYNQVASQNRASNFMAPPGFALVQNSQSRFNQNQGQGNNFNRGNNFHGNQPFQVPNQGFQNQPFQVPNNPVQQGTLSSNTIPNPKGKMKVITTRSGVAYEGPSIPTPKKVVKREIEETIDKEQTNFQGSIAHIQPPVTPILEPDVLKTLPKPNIPYPSRLNDQKLLEKATNEIEKFLQIFQDLYFDISFADALLLMPKFASTIKSLHTNKHKLFELAKISLNENCSVMLLKKLPKKLGDPGKFLIPCDFSGMDVCRALADLDASINLMHVFIWKKLSLPKLTPTRMTLELADRSITRPIGVTEDVFVKVGKFHFLANFVVVDFEANPHTTRYSSTYDDLLVNRIDIIDVAREEYAQEILGFSKNSSGGNPTSTSEPIISDSSSLLTSFEGSDFILEEIEAYLKDESISSEIDHPNCDPKGDICLIEKLLNNDPFQLPLMDLKQGEVVKEKSSIEEPPKLELKDLPSHLDYAYLEGVDKLPVIITKDLKDNEKEALLKEDYKPVVQSQRRVNPKIHEVIKKKVIKLLNARMIYLIFDSPWVSPIHCVTKKGGITVVENENNELIPTRLVTGWRVCIDYRKLNDATLKDYFPLPFMDQMLE